MIHFPSSVVCFVVGRCLRSSASDEGLLLGCGFWVRASSSSPDFLPLVGLLSISWVCFIGSLRCQFSGVCFSPRDGFKKVSSVEPGEKGSFAAVELPLLLFCAPFSSFWLLIIRNW